jgi:hypothetical protein
MIALTSTFWFLIRCPSSLIDGALEAVDLGRDQLEAPVHDPVNVLGVELFGERRETGHVGEEHRHLSTLALQGGAAGQDLLGEMLGGVGGELGLKVCADGRGQRTGGRLAFQDCETMPALETELGVRRQLGAALRARCHEALTTLETELRAVRVVVPAGWTDHVWSSRRPSARARSSTSRTGRPFARAILRTSSNSGVAVTTRPSRRETL